MPELEEKLGSRMSYTSLPNKKVDSDLIFSDPKLSNEDSLGRFIAPTDQIYPPTTSLQHHWKGEWLGAPLTAKGEKDSPSLLGL